MSRNKKKKNMAWLAYPVYLCIGGVFGACIPYFVEQILGEDASTAQFIAAMCAVLAIFMVMLYIQIIIHEAGHLVFGLISGYSFSSFRIANLMWINEDGKLRLKRYSIAGTAGQCLMTPPELKDGKCPVVLYNLGGVFMNIIVSCLCLAAFFLLRSYPAASYFFASMAYVGILIALMNGLPIKIGTVDNDGCNALDLVKNSGSVRAFWLQLKINEQQTRNVRLKDMPDEWFELPPEDKMGNALTADIAVLAVNRLMDRHDFAAAKTLMDELLVLDTGIPELNERLMICDRIYLELLEDPDSKLIPELLDKKQKKFMVQMKTFISVVRTEYAYAKLYERDEEKAEMIKNRFDKIASRHPYKPDVDSETEFMALVG